MKKTIFYIHFVFLLLSLISQFAYSQTEKPFSINESPLPKTSSPVLDNADVLDSATKQRLEEKIIKFQKESEPSVELAVAIVKTTGNRPIFDYSIAVARGWGIGSRDKDNPGALLFIAIEDRKYFTQVSSDLEDELPDGLVGMLQRQYLVPQFKKSNYAKGIEDTIDAYIRVIKSKQIDFKSEGDTFKYPEFVPTGTTQNNDSNYSYNRDSEMDLGKLFFCLLIIGFIIFIAIANSGGGGGGGKRRRKYKHTGDDVVGDILVGVLSGIVAGGSSGGSSSSDWGSGGSDWGGSSGGSWGGFGGGGDFGGGGAGGGW